MHLLLLVAKGQKKNNVFQCLCVHHMLAPWSTSNSHEDCGRHTACSVLRWLPRASSLPGLAKDREAMPPFTTGELALWKRQGMKEGHCCLATPRGVPSCPPMGLWSSGSGRTSHSVPSQGLQSSVSGWTPRMACSSSGVNPSKFCRSHTKRYT